MRKGVRKIAQGRWRREQRQREAADRQLSSTKRKLAEANAMLAAFRPSGYPAEDMAAAKDKLSKRVAFLAERLARDERRHAELAGGGIGR